MLLLLFIIHVKMPVVLFLYCIRLFPRLRCSKHVHQPYPNPSNVQRDTICFTLGSAASDAGYCTTQVCHLSRGICNMHTSVVSLHAMQHCILISEYEPHCNIASNSGLLGNKQGWVSLRTFGSVQISTQMSPKMYLNFLG